MSATPIPLPTLNAILQLGERAGIPAAGRSALRERLDYFAADLFPNHGGFFAAIFTSGHARQPLPDTFSLWDLGMSFWRERDASLEQRRKEGCFYTPVAAVDAVLDLVWPRLFPGGKIATDAAVLDPAVGCGFFPLRIIERLRRSKSVSLDAIREWAAASLYAIDIDPAAVFMTRTILWLALSNRSGEFLPPIRHIVAGDALLGPGFGTRDGATTAAMVRNKNRLDWQAAFPDIAAAAGFAAVIGNPPYEVLTNFSRHPERAELAQAVRDSGFYRDSLSGQINLYRCFIERGLDSLRPGGELAMVVPLSLARDAAALPLRRRLIGQCHADEWLLYGEDAELFPGVTQSACIFKAVNNGEKAERLRIVDAGQPRRPVSVIAVNALSRLTGGALTLPQLDRDGAKLLTWLADNCPGQLGQAADCRVGEVDQTIYRDCMRDDDTGCVLARGAHLSPFFLDVSPVPGKARFLDLPLFLRRKGAQAEQVEKRNGVWRIAQLGIRNMHTLPRLVAGLIPPGVYAGNSINLFTPRQNGPETVTLDFLAAMLNSSILDWLFRLGSGNNNINLHEMRRLPFPVDPPNDAAGQAAQAFRDCAELAKQRHNVEPTDTTFSANDEKYKSAILRLNRTAVACYRFPESLDELAKSLFVKDQ